MLILRNLLKSPSFGLSHIQAIQKYTFGMVKFHLPDLGEKIK